MCNFCNCFPCCCNSCQCCCNPCQCCCNPCQCECCCPIFECPVPSPPPQKEKVIISNCKPGTINVPCGSTEVIYSAMGLQTLPSGSINIRNSSGICSVNVIVNGNLVRALQPGAGFTADFQSISEVSLACFGTTSGQCTVEFTITTNFFS